MPKTYVHKEKKDEVTEKNNWKSLTGVKAKRKEKNTYSTNHAEK
jgi:hypothetical protein